MRTLNLTDAEARILYLMSTVGINAHMGHHVEAARKLHMADAECRRNVGDVATLAKKMDQLREEVFA